MNVIRILLSDCFERNVYIKLIHLFAALGRSDTHGPTGQARKLVPTYVCKTSVNIMDH